MFGTSAFGTAYFAQGQKLIIRQRPVTASGGGGQPAREAIWPPIFSERDRQKPLELGGLATCRQLALHIALRPVRAFAVPTALRIGLPGMSEADDAELCIALAVLVSQPARADAAALWALIGLDPRFAQAMALAHLADAEAMQAVSEIQIIDVPPKHLGGIAPDPTPAW
jgi:hypothetical protein